MMKKGLILASTIALSLFISQPLMAVQNGNNHTMGMKKGMCPDRMKEMMTKLNLTEAQKKQIQDIKDRYMQQMRAQYDELKSLRTQMHDLVKADQMDESKLDDLITKKKEILASLMKSKVMMKREIYAVLTPEQKKQYDDMMMQWENQMMENHKTMNGSNNS